ncbi:MAG: DUF4097 family beta strand repeat-containing protein, partial [Candidatus Eisenbacteria bacterium]
MRTSHVPRLATRTSAGMAFAVLALLAVVGRPRAESGEPYTNNGADVGIYDLAGAGRVDPGGNGVTVQITRGGADASRLDVQTGAIGAQQTLRVRFPADRVSYRALEHGTHNSLRVRDDGTFGDDRDGSEGRRVTIERDGDGLEAWADLAVSVPRGQRLTLHLGAGTVTVTNIDGDLHVDAASGPVTATGTHGRLSVDTGSGAIAIRDAQGEIALDTGSGSVEATGVRGSGLSVDTGSGHVTVDDARVDRLHLDTGSGGIGVRALQSRVVDIDTGSGGIDVDLAGDVESLTADTGSGHLTLAVPPNLGATFEASS